MISEISTGILLEAWDSKTDKVYIISAGRCLGGFDAEDKGWANKADYR